MRRVILLTLFVVFMLTGVCYGFTSYEWYSGFASDPAQGSLYNYNPYGSPQIYSNNDCSSGLTSNGFDCYDSDSFIHNRDPYERNMDPYSNFGWQLGD